MEILWSKKAIKQLLSMDIMNQKVIIKRINSISHTPAIKLDLKILKNKEHQFMIRINALRIIFQIKKSTLSISKINQMKTSPTP